MLLTFFPQKTVFTVKCLLSDYVHDAAQYYMKGTGISWIEAVCISFCMRICLKDGTADFIKKVLSVYAHSMTAIYQSLSTQVAKSTFFMKSPV